MIRLRTLGAIDLRSDHDAPVGSVLAQPRRLALLVHLALALPREREGQKPGDDAAFTHDDLLGNRCIADAPLSP